MSGTSSSSIFVPFVVVLNTYKYKPKEQKKKRKKEKEMDMYPLEVLRLDSYAPCNA